MHLVDAASLLSTVMNDTENVDDEVLPRCMTTECAIAGESRPPRPKLREIARFWINSLRAAIYAGDAGVRVVGVPVTPEMGNLQSDSKRKNKKNKTIDSDIEDTRSRDDKLSRSLDDLDQTGTKVAFEKVQTPARRHHKAPKVSLIHFNSFHYKNLRSCDLIFAVTMKSLTY